MSDVLKLSTPSGDDEANQIADAKALAEKKARITQLEKSNADLEKLIAQKGSGGAPAREGMRKNADYKAVSTAPSINKTPRGRSTPRLPYPTVQDLSNSEAIVPTVTLNGDPAYVLNQTVQPSCKGDDPGTALGVKSGTVNGYVQPTGASSTVTMGGKPAVRIGDPCVMNGGNNPGIYVTAAPASANPAQSAASTGNPPQTLETPAEKSWFERGRDYFKEKLTPAAEQPVEATKGAAKGIANTPSHVGDVIGQGSMLKQAADLQRAAAFQSLFGMDDAARASAETAQVLREGASHFSLPKLEMSNKAQESGDFIATGVQLLTGLAGMTKAVAKGAAKGIPTLLKEAKVAETVVADTAKGAGKTAAKGADEAAEVAAAKATKAEQAAAKEPMSPGDGVVVKPKGGVWKNAPNHKKWLEKGGKIEEHPDGSITYKSKDGISVTYDKNGNPDFSPYQNHPSGIKNVEVDGLVGDTYNDFKKANEAANLPYGGRSPPDYTWHHAPDGKTMQLVPAEIHGEFTHAGGASNIRNGL